VTKRTGKRQIGIKEIIASLFLIVLLWVGQEFIDLDPFTEAILVEAEPGGALQIHFTAPRYPDTGDRTGGLDMRLVAAIDRAQQRVDVAAFELNLPSVTEALVRAHRRGVHVRLVTDSDYEDRLGPVELRKAGIPVVYDNRSAFMHNKFVVIDGYETWTGSWNLTENCTFRNNNNVVVIQSAKMAANYTTEFEEMFERGEFGPTSSDATPHPDIDLNGIRIETIFESEGNARERIIELIHQTRSSIALMAFVFTDDEIADALITRHRAGVEVVAVMEARNAAGLGSDFAAFEAAGIDILKDGNPYILHHKVIVLDESIVITGSYNFSVGAATNNDENVLIIHSPEIAAIYLGEFDRVYEEAVVAAYGDP
jgi:phosphatidylserine/phosphatidylglycerophosphate/cardiolipin synthase-like enzyme